MQSPTTWTGQAAEDNGRPRAVTERLTQGESEPFVSEGVGRGVRSQPA
jgi:hypothetical protein